jgi:hypothetical protein
MPRLLSLFALLACLVVAPVDGRAPAPEAAETVQVPFRGVVLHRPAHFVDRERFVALSEAVVVVAAVPAAPAALADTFIEAAKTKADSLSRSEVPHILSVGPVLDSPDSVVVRKLTRRGRHLALDIAYTSARAAGVELRRNVPWRPLVEVPVELPPGRYELEVTWTAVASLPDGKPYPAVTAHVRKREFTIREGK